MFERRRPITENVFIFAIIIFLALTPLAWASTLEILKLSASPNPFTPDRDGIDDFTVITATASKVVNWTYSITDFFGQGSKVNNTPVEGTTFEYRWNGLISSPGPPPFYFTVYAKDEEGNKTEKTVEINWEFEEQEESQPVTQKEPLQEAQKEPLPKILDFSLTPSTFTPNGDGVDEVLKIKASFSEVVSYRVCVITPEIACLDLDEGEASAIETEWNGYILARDKTFGLMGPEKISGVYTLVVEIWDERNERVNVSGEAELFDITSIEPGEAIKILDISVSPDSITRYNDRMDNQVKISASFSKSGNYKIEIWNTAGGSSYYLTDGVGDSVETTWDGVYVPTSSTVGLATAGTYKIIVSIKDEFGRIITDAAYVDVLESLVQTSPKPIPLFTTEPPPYTLKPVDLPAIKDFKISTKSITLDGDGVDDVALIKASASEEVEWVIYVREPSEIPVRKIWGGIGTTLTVKWDGLNDAGKVVEEGEYVLIVSAYGKEGVTEKAITVTVTGSQVPHMTECVKQAVGLGILQDEAERKCTVMSIEEVRRCTSLDEKLIDFSYMIWSATPEERKGLEEYLEKLEGEMEECAVPLAVVSKGGITRVTTISIRDPCIDVERLKEEVAGFKYDASALEGMVNRGEITETDVREYKVEMELAKEELEKAKEICQESRIEMITSLDDVEKVHLKNIETSIKEAKSGEDLVETLAKIEEEKNRLIVEFTKNLQELEFKKTKIIKKLKIEGGEFSLDDIKITVPTVKIEVEGVEIEIRSKDGEVEIVEGGISVTSALKLEYFDDVLTAVKSGRPIKILPSELKKIVTGKIGEVELVDDGTPKYIVKSTEDGKLLGIISVTMSKESQINAEDGKIVKETKPWWSFLVLG